MQEERGKDGSKSEGEGEEEGLRERERGIQRKSERENKQEDEQGGRDKQKKLVDNEIVDEHVSVSRKIKTGENAKIKTDVYEEKQRKRMHANERDDDKTVKTKKTEDDDYKRQ